MSEDLEVNCIKDSGLARIDLDAPTIFADSLGRSMFDNMNARFAIFEKTYDWDKENMFLKHTYTLVLPADEVQKWADYLSKVADEMKRVYPPAGEVEL